MPFKTRIHFFFLLLFQNILEFPVGSVAIDSNNKKNTVTMVVWLSKVLEIKQSLESSASQTPGIIQKKVSTVQ